MHQVFNFWGQGQSVTVEPNMLENALLALLHDILKITGLNFTKLLALMHFGRRINASVLGSKVLVKGDSMTRDPAGGGIESSTLYF